jgi:hypothetical protein
MLLACYRFCSQGPGKVGPVKLPATSINSGEHGAVALILHPAAVALDASLAGEARPPTR